MSSIFIFLPMLKGARHGVEAICAMCREAKADLGEVPAAKSVDAIVSIASQAEDFVLSDAFATNASTCFAHGPTKQNRTLYVQGFRKGANRICEVIYQSEV